MIVAIIWLNCCQYCVKHETINQCYVMPYIWKKQLNSKGQFTRFAFAAALVQSCKRRTCKLRVMHCRPASRPIRTCSISVCKADVTDQFRESRNGKQNV